MASGSLLCSFKPQQAIFPTTNYPTFDVRNTHVVLDFDKDTDETCYFEGVLPSNYTGGGVTVRVYWMATSAATTGTACWSVAWERHADDAFDLDGDSFGAEGTVTATTASVNGEVDYADITFTHGAAMSSVAANEHFRLRIFRDVSADDLAVDAELLALTIRET